MAPIATAVLGRVVHAQRHRVVDAEQLKDLHIRLRLPAAEAAG